ncbi:MAG: sigma-70 family RNA polymerase sigma factor [Polyangiales bacterium]
MQQVFRPVPHRIPLTTSPPAALPAAAAVPDGFAEIVRAHSQYVWRVLRCLGVREADIDDLCQETFVVVHRKWPSYEPRGALRTWIYAIALRVVSDYRKRAHRKRETLVAEPPDVRVGAEQEQKLERREDWQLLDHLMHTLTDDQRQVFVLFEIEELAMAEVAQVVGCPLQTAYSRLHAARKQIALQLAQHRAQEGGT